MSLGSPQVILRVPQHLLDRIDEEVWRQNASRAGEPYDRSSWIRQAITERLAKLERGRKPTGRIPLITDGGGDAP